MCQCWRTINEVPPRPLPPTSNRPSEPGHGLHLRKKKKTTTKNSLTRLNITAKTCFIFFRSRHIFLQEICRSLYCATRKKERIACAPMWMSLLLMCNVQLFVWGSAGTEAADDDTFFLLLEHEEEQMHCENPCVVPRDEYSAFQCHLSFHFTLYQIKKRLL